MRTQKYTRCWAATPAIRIKAPGKRQHIIADTHRHANPSGLAGEELYRSSLYVSFRTGGAQ